jgi:glucokinase
MSVLGIDLGGTKLSLAVFSEEGKMLHRHSQPLLKREGQDVGRLITSQTLKILHDQPGISSIGVAVPGIYRQDIGRVWAPNIKGWEDYPLLSELSQMTGLGVYIDSDRSCSILGESWLGNAKGCKHAIFLSVGTGIGAGILADGRILRGANDIAGAIGWMALQHPVHEKFISCGCFEHHASGDGIAKVAEELIKETGNYRGRLIEKKGRLTAPDIFAAYDEHDLLAIEVFRICIVFWGMAVANLVSLFNPQKIILGGGVFGPASSFLPGIRAEAAKWAQPVSFKQVSIECSALGSDACLIGTGALALNNQGQYV